MKFCLVLFAVSAASAQVLTPLSQAKPLLQSASLRDKAWGAWLAGASRDTALKPFLVEQLRQAQLLRNAPFGSPEDATIQTLFDALIQIAGPVPGDAVLPFETSWRAEILILLSRASVDSATEYALLDMRDQPMPEPEWIAVNDLLFAASSRAFFQKLLQEIRITHHLVVTDGGGAGYGCGGGGVVFDYFAPPAQPDFPPAERYELTTTQSPGDALLTSQPIPIYSRTTSAPPLPLAAPPDRQTLIARFLQAVNGPSGADTIFHRSTTVQSAGEIENAIADQSDAVRSVVAAIQRTIVIDASGMRFPIEVTIEDLRANRATPLPAIPPHDISIP